MAKVEKKKKNALVSYFEASYEELRKVAWPTRNRAIRVTFLVLGFVFVIAFIIGMLDFVFGLGRDVLFDLAPDRALPTVQTTQPLNNSIQPQPGDVLDNIIDVGDISVTTSTGEELDVTPLETPSDEIPEILPETTDLSPETETPSEETPS